MQRKCIIVPRVPHCPTFGTRDTFGFRYANVLKTSTSRFRKSVPLENGTLKWSTPARHNKVFTKTIKTLLLIFSFQDNWLVFIVYARKQVYEIYHHQHQPPCISCAEISKSENIKKRRESGYKILKFLTSLFLFHVFAWKC